MASGKQDFPPDFSKYRPEVKIGCLQPGAVIDVAPYEFYRLAPPRVMNVMIGVGLKEFSSQDVTRVFEPIDRYLDALVERGVDLVMQNGVPLPLLMGMEKHDGMIEHMKARTGLPATTTMECVVRTARDLGLSRVVPVNKWTAEMNATLAGFFLRESVSVVGSVFDSRHPSDFHKIDSGEHMRLAYELGKKAFEEHPDCDAVYIGGGSWIAEPVAQELERRFEKPVLCNQTAVIRHVLKMLGRWTPVPGHSITLSQP